jgi:hypothetical protein
MLNDFFIYLTRDSYMQLHAPTAVAVAPLSSAGVPTASALTRFSTSPKRLHHRSSRTASSPIWFCPSTRGCTHEVDAVPATWSSVPRISFRLHTSRRQRTSLRRGRRESAPEGLHEKVLDLVDGQACLRRDRREGERAVVGIAPEDRLDERHEADLLAQERVVLLQDRLNATSAFACATKD